jgi:hypothetical protein
MATAFCLASDCSPLVASFAAQKHSASRAQRCSKVGVPKLLQCVPLNAHDEVEMQAVPSPAADKLNPRHGLRGAATVVLGLGLWASATQAAAVEIYRCQGNPAVYTSDLRLVRAGRCTRLGATPVAARQVAPVATAPTARAQPAAAPLPTAARSGSVTTVARQVQQQRDSDRVQILESELTRERERLAQLTQQMRELQSAPPDAAAAKRSETVALAQAIRRSEDDLQALDKELARAVR